MTDGINNPSTFLSPWQQPETVAEKIYEKIISGSSGMVFVPDAAWHFGWILRSMPMWWQTIIRNSGGHYVPSNIVVAKAAEEKGGVA